MIQDLFSFSASEAPQPPTRDLDTSRQRELGQYQTPFWAAEALVSRHFCDLTANDAVAELTCGTGAFLRALPEYVPAIGIEIDPQLADIARHVSGRRVITGDFRTVQLDFKPNLVLGNPPFEMGLVDELLDYSHKLLPTDGRVALVLPAFATQTASRVARYSDSWSMQAELLPRTLFRGLQCPLTFMIFRKDQRRLLVGMALYHEQADIESMPEPVREALQRGATTWFEVVRDALDRLGGRAKLEDIYRCVEPRRPTNNPWWKEQCRKVLRTRFHSVAPAEYALAA